MRCSTQQRCAFDKIREGCNVFITGPGGSGKSTMIRFAKSYFDSIGKTVQVCALTGCAANLLNCNARTVHSWAGIGIANGPNDEIAAKVRGSMFAKKAWLTTKVLIIDEVSMMSKKLFDLLDIIGRTVRRGGFGLPFGGIQVIFLGDFFQLPPVGGEFEDSDKFCFESERWSKTFALENHIVFDAVFRQKDDLEYIKILSQIRRGVVKRSSYNKLLEMLNAYPDKIAQLERAALESNQVCMYPVRIYPTKKKTAVLNQSELSKLTGPSYTYELKYILDIPLQSANDRAERHQHTATECNAELRYIESNLLCDNKLVLKTGARVMYIINNPGIEKVNGSQGVVIGFVTDKNLPIVRFDDGAVCTISHHTWVSERIKGIGVEQMPLILAWAVTIHKAQGVTLDAAEIDAGRDIFECGQTYVAMSRIKSLNGLYLKSFQCEQIKSNAKVQEFYNTIDRATNGMHQNRDVAEVGQISCPDNITIFCTHCFKEVIKSEQVGLECGHILHSKCLGKSIIYSGTDSILCPTCKADCGCNTDVENTSAATVDSTPPECAICMELLDDPTKEDEKVCSTSAATANTNPNVFAFAQNSTLPHAHSTRKHKIRLQCMHAFHVKCIADWFKRNTTCPCCRTDASFDDISQTTL